MTKKGDTIMKRLTFKILYYIAASLLIISAFCQLVWRLNSWHLSLSDHEHDYNFTNSDLHNHWQQCECGEIQNQTKHSFIRDKNTKYHWEFCNCGRINGYEIHSFASWSIITEASETSSGLKESFCDICDFYTINTIPKIPHEHNYSEEWNWDELNHWQECVCGEKSAFLSHKYGEWVVTQEATIHATGIQENICETCRFVIIKPLPHTHSFDSIWEKDASKHWHLCYCGEKSDVASHSYGSWKTTRAATINATGEQKRSCNDCKFTETKTIPKIPHTHSYTNTWFNDENEHWNQCSSCHDRINISAHTLKETTSTDASKKRKICTVCSYWQTEKASGN